MSAEFAELATSGATTLVGLMVTDAWTQARDRVVALFGRARAEDLTAQLEVVRGEIVAGGDATEATSELAPKLRRALAAEPDVADELLALLAELTPQAAEPGSFRNTINGGTFHGTVVQAGSVRELTINPGS